jgi:formamidopyrimidine-DNA glycosylase
MPELPDVTVYVECLERRIAGHVLEGVRLATPFLLRSVDPPIAAAAGARVRGVSRLGKRIVVALERAAAGAVEGGVSPSRTGAQNLFLVIHLMIAGRLRWRDKAAKVPKKLGLAAFDFSSGTLLLTEAGTKRRASLHVVGSDAALREMNRGGIEPLDASAAEFARALTRENHTLKRALTDPRLFSGIGNAYSDEILHRARISPLALTSRLGDAEIARLFEATRATLVDWTERLRADAEAEGGFPEKVTAFREGMAVHGRFGKPCPVCGSPVQRIVYAENETNYCARCQTVGRLLADRALSRLLKDDWPRSLDELEK